MTSDGGNHWDEDEPQIELRGDPAYRQGGMAYTAGGYDEESPHQAPRSRRFGPLRFALVGVALIVLAGLTVYAYSWGTADPSPDELPLIAAPSGAEKEPPSNPGGMEVPYQDSMLLNPQSAKGEEIERLLPPPEEPQPAPRAETPEPQLPPGEAEDAPVVSSMVDDEQGASDEQSPANRTATEEPTTGATSASDNREGEDAGIPKPPGEAEASSQRQEPPLEEVESAAEPMVEEEAPAEPDVSETAATSGAFMIQLASASNRDAVEDEWTKLQQRHPDELGRLELHIEEADLGDRGIFYRLQAGPFTSREAAAATCGKLEAQKQDCLVRAR